MDGRDFDGGPIRLIGDAYDMFPAGMGLNSRGRSATVPWIGDSRSVIRSGFPKFRTAGWGPPRKTFVTSRARKSASVKSLPRIGKRSVTERATDAVDH